MLALVTNVRMVGIGNGGWVGIGWVGTGKKEGVGFGKRWLALIVVLRLGKCTCSLAYLNQQENGDALANDC